MRTALLCFFLFLIRCTTSQAQYTLETKYIVGPTLPTPVGVVLDDAGSMYVANNLQIRVLDSGGNFVKDIPVSDVPFYGHANAIARDATGNLYVWNSYNFYLYKYDPDGTLLHKFKNTYTNTYISSYVEGIAVAPDGSIYITDVHKHVVRKFTNDGQLLLEINNLKTPTDVAVGPDGSLYVADTGNKRIVKFTETGALVAAYTTPGNGQPAFNKPTGVEVDKKGAIYAADAGAGMLYSFKEDNTPHFILPLPNIDPNGNLGVALDATGHMYVSVSNSTATPSGNGKIIKLLPGGERESEFGELDPPIETIKLNAFEIDSVGHYFYVANDLTGKIQTYNRQGIKLMEFGSNGQDSSFNAIQDIAAGPNGTLYVIESMTAGRVKQFSAMGKFISEFDAIPSDETSSRHRYKITAGLDHYYYVLTEGKVVKYNKLGKLQQVITLSDIYTTTPAPIYQDIAVDAQGNLYVIIIVDQTNPLNTVYKVNKYNTSGEFLLKYETRGRQMLEVNVPKSIDLDQNGNVYIAGTSVEIFDTEGRLTGYVPVTANEIAVSATGNAMLAGMLHKGQVLVLGKVSDSQQGYITGTIYHDANGNSIPDTDEPRLRNISVRAEPGSLFGFSDINGVYKIPVEDVGTYEITQLIPLGNEDLGIKQTSPADRKPHSVTISDSKRIITGVNFGNFTNLSPYLSVSVSSDRRRRCFDSTTKLTYTNSGFAPATNAKVYLQLPKEVELLTADKPYTRLPNGTYVFEAGTVPPGQTRTITIQDKVVCGDESIRGLTVCTRAWITPGNQSPTAPPTAVAAVTGKCDFEKGMVRFVIKNTGQNDMDAQKAFRLYLDGQLSTIEGYKLAADDSLVLWIPTAGKTARLEADQPDGNGDNILASATVEACRVVATRETFSTGFVNAMPNDDEEAEVAEECLPIIDSYDPNDKLVSPVGLTEENYTPIGTALKYKIRFQNTGTDVAYRVVVVDTLSEHLDLSTLQLGATSHTARFELSGKGKPVLTWTFDNIMLPDSTTNEPGSHGFIQFSIKPKADLAEKTAVENFADIFFDFNSPVRTNVTTNRIYDMPLVIDENVRMNADDIIATPDISGFFPAAGKFGAEVILTGRKFSTTAADNKVYFNGVPATVVNATETELRVLVPTASVTGKLKIETPDGAASTTENFEVYQPPVLNSFSPVEGVPGSTVTLRGEYLNTNLIQRIKLGEVDCEIISNSGSTLVVKVPAHALTGTFEVETKGGQAISSAAYVVWHQPAINSLSKESDIVGATIQLNGENFASAAERNIVLFGQVKAQVLQAAKNQLTAQVPQGATSGYVSVQTPGGTATSATYFEVIPGPVFVSMSPAKGSVGTTVEISGSHFGMRGKQDEVTFNGETAQILEASEATYKVQVPRGATTGKVKITGFGGEAYSTTDFIVETLSPAQAIEVYPNPTSGKFTISFLHADFDILEVQVYTSPGKLIHTAPLTKPRPEKLDVNMEATKPGMYLLQIKTDRGVVIKKLSVL